MGHLRIIRAKPNPAGKDRMRTTTPPAQLAGEWVDFRNDGVETCPLDRLGLYHLAYRNGCSNGDWQKLQGFRGRLGPGQTIRVHSGNEIPLSQMYPVDVAGVDFHLFTGLNYAWNNVCGDTAALWDGRAMIDKASYLQNPPEGHILIRRGDLLVAA